MGSLTLFIQTPIWNAFFCGMGVMLLYLLDWALLWEIKDRLHKLVKLK